MGGFYRLVVRPMAAFLLLLLIVTAAVQAMGRFGMWLLDDLEGSVNAWFDGQVRFGGLAGDWSGLNPVFSVGRIEIPAGQLEGVTVEFDVVESVRRSRLVFERLFIEDGELRVERSADGWRLAGMEVRASPVDLMGIFRESDEVRLQGRVAVAGAENSDLAVRALGVNRDGAHSYDLWIGRPGCAGDCRLHLRWRARDGAWLGRAEERYLAVSGGFVVPGPFVDWLGPVSGAQVRAGGRWLERGDAGGGEFRLNLDRVGLPGGVSGALAADLRGGYRDGRREGRLSGLTLAAGESRLELAPVYLRSVAQGAEFWTGALPLGELADFLAAALAGVETARAWLGALKPGGDLLNVHALFGPDGVGYAATFDGLRLDPYKGVPWLRDAAGEIIGYERGARVALNSDALRVGFADVFTDRWRWANVHANLYAWYGDGYLGMRVPYFKLRAQASDFSGSFALARPAERMDQRVAALVNIDGLDMQQARTYIPYRLSDELRKWLRDGPQAGRLTNPRLAYQGQVHTVPDDRSRRLEIQARLSGGVVRYHADWPLVAEAEGFIELAGSETYAQVESARTLAARIHDSTVLIGDGGAFARLALRADLETGDGLDFVRGSPLADWLTFVAPEWDGTGSLGLRGDLHIPIDETAGPVDGRFDVDLDDVSLALPDFRLAVENLNGPVRYRYPHYLDAEPLRGQLFGRSASIAAQSDDDSIDFRFQGTATESDIYQLLDMSDPGVVAGQTSFDATLAIAVDDAASTLRVTSDLVGIDIGLPGEFAKVAETASPSEFNLKFLEDHVLFQMHHGELSGWLHVDDVPLRGAIGVRGAPPLVGPEADEVVVSGRVVDVDLGEWMAGAGQTDVPVPWRLVDVGVDRLRVETVVFDDVWVAGEARDGSMELNLTSTDLIGRVQQRDGEPLDLDFESIRLPEAEDEEDPLDVALIERVPDADVAIDSLTIGDEDFGNWSFNVRQAPGGLLVDDLSAELKGTKIVAREGVFWDAATDRSSAAVRLTMEDLAEVLPQWDYAPSLEAESAELEVDASWPGSPVNVEVNGLRGDVAFRAENGSFVEVSSSGALRMLSLLNFNTILKRMSFNFKDVVTKGTSFDTIEANTRFDDGLLTFVAPAKVKGSGSDFKIGGSVNLVDGIMNDNEMIVTLPVSDSLPWYAVYISLANPAAAVAVLAGQQVLKKQIKQFSSAKYQISGSWDDPEVKLVGIWNNEVEGFDDLAQDKNAPGYGDEATTEGE